MMANENDAILKVAKDLEAQGYRVAIEPDSSLIPFSLGRYRPDILATRGEENLIVEIKLRKSARNMEAYKEISNIISQHKNWKFLLSTIDDQYEDGHAISSTEINVETIKRQLRKIGILVSSDAHDLAIPYLWEVYILSLRSMGQAWGVPIDATSDKSVLHYTYSLGEISHEDYQKSLELMALRNGFIHNIDMTMSKDEVVMWCKFVAKKLIEWKITDDDGLSLLRIA